MAFLTLFSSLSGIEEDGGSLAEQRAFTHRNVAGVGPRGGFGKRKTNGEQPGPHGKRPCCTAQTNTPPVASTNRNWQHPHAADRGSNHRGSNPQRANGSDTNKEQKQGKKKKKKNNNNRQQVPDGGRQGNHGDTKGGPRHRQEKKPKLLRMDPKFKEQNVVEVNGRMLCRHFFLGLCVKGEECKLEHVPGYNDLIKECCKFYVQGYCLRGQACPFMHNSFPCKFFHRGGLCNKGANCRFSHDPLDDVTARLLEETVKQQNDLNEVAKRAKEESSGLSDVPEASNGTDVKPTSDVATARPLRPNFYNSAEKDKPPGESEQAAAPSPASDDDPAASPPSPQTSPRPEPVCYSVEAVLGPSLFKPFMGFQTKSGDSKSTSPSADVSLNRTDVPYSVDAVLRSSKAGGIASGPTSAPPAGKMLLYTPRTGPKENLDTSQRSPEHNEKDLADNDKVSVRESQTDVFRRQPAPQETNTSLYGSWSSEKRPKSLKTTQTSSPEAKLETYFPPGPERGSCESLPHTKERLSKPPDPAGAAGLRSQRTSNSSARKDSLTVLSEIRRGETTQSPHKSQDQNTKVSLQMATDGVTESGKRINKTLRTPQNNTESSGLSKICTDDERDEGYLKTAPKPFHQVKRSVSLGTPNHLRPPSAPWRNSSFSTLFARPIADPPVDEPELQGCRDVPRKSRREKGFSGFTKAHGDDWRRKESLKTDERSSHDVSSELKLPSVATNPEKCKEEPMGWSDHTADPKPSEGQNRQEASEVPHWDSSFTTLFSRPIADSGMSLERSRDLEPSQRLSRVQEEPGIDEVSLHVDEEPQTQGRLQSPPSRNQESSASPHKDRQTSFRFSDSGKKMLNSSNSNVETNKHLYQPIDAMSSIDLKGCRVRHLDLGESSFSSLFARPITDTTPCAPPTEKTTNPDLKELASLDTDKSLSTPQKPSSRCLLSPEKTWTSPGLSQEHELTQQVSSKGKLRTGDGRQPNVESTRHYSPKHSESRHLGNSGSVGPFPDGWSSDPDHPREGDQSPEWEHLLSPSGNSDCNLSLEPPPDSQEPSPKVLPEVLPSKGSLLKTLFLSLGPFQEEGS